MTGVYLQPLVCCVAARVLISHASTWLSIRLLLLVAITTPAYPQDPLAGLFVHLSTNREVDMF